MSFDGFFDSPGFNANVSLRDRSGTVLQESLDKGNVIPAVLVDLGSIPLPEAVSAYSIVAQIVTDNVQLFLYGSFGDRENGEGAWDAVAQTVVLDVLLNYKGNCERSELASFLLGNVQAEAITITDDVAKSKLQNVADSQT